MSTLTIVGDEEDAISQYREGQMPIRSLRAFTIESNARAYISSTMYSARVKITMPFRILSSQCRNALERTLAGYSAYKPSRLKGCRCHLRAFCRARNFNNVERHSKEFSPRH